MKAIVWTKYGPPEVLQLQEVEKPTPKANEILVRIYATTVTAGDCEFRSLKLPIYMSLPMRLWIGPRKPRGTMIIGTELAGEIEEVGVDVKRYKVGDQVFGSTGMSFGTNAEYVSMPEDGTLALKPGNMTYEEAAAVPFGGLDALHFLRKGNIGSGQKILINGAGGSIGTLAIQLAKHFGAEVTAVDSASKLDMLRSIGADHVIDYTQEDFTKNGQSYDAIFEVVGKGSYSGSIRSLKESGRYLLANPRMYQMIRGPLTSMRSSKKVIIGAASHTSGNLNYLKRLIEEGKIKTVIDRSYPLEQIAEAHRYAEKGGKKGNIVITVTS
jgi:NADPH:quinone reductase-like Zn-dependent oxidoreductase